MMCYTSLEPYACGSCDLNTPLKVTLINHVKHSHKQERTKNLEPIPLRNYPCKKCDFQANSLLILMKHSYNCNRPKDYRCEQCKSRYKRKDYLRKHILKEHADSTYNKWYKCEQCAYETMYKSHLNRHKLTKHSVLGAELQCEQCTYKAKTKDNLRKHAKRKHNETAPTPLSRASQCNHSVDLEKQQESHMQEEHKERQFPCHTTPLQSYQCDNCSFRTNLQVVLEDHQKTHHQPEGPALKLHDCEKCDFQTYSLLVLNKHSDMCDKPKGRYKCDKCSSCYTRIDHLRTHIVKKHADSKYNKWFKCEQCTYQTMYTSHLYRHILRKHTPKVRDLQCEYCTYNTKIRENLRKHFRTHHVDPNEFCWRKCELCQYKCEVKRDMDKHMKRMHTPLQIAVKCNYCEYTTNTKGDLEVHKKEHTEVRSVDWIQCKQCYFKCKRNYIMRRHMKKHTQHLFFCHSTLLRTHKCDSCDFRTHLKVALANHIKIIHKEGSIVYTSSSYQCDKCSFHTFSLLVLAQHWYTCNKQIEKPERPYKCEMCSSCYKRKDHLKSHLMTKHQYTFQMTYKNHTTLFIRQLHCESCTFKTKN